MDPGGVGGVSPVCKNHHRVFGAGGPFNFHRTWRSRVLGPSSGTARGAVRERLWTGQSIAGKEGKGATIDHGAASTVLIRQLRIEYNGRPMRAFNFEASNQRPARR